MNSGIYRIDLGNGWFYIGSSADLITRKNQHYRELKCKIHGNRKMQNCWNKYGIFSFTVLQECEISKLLSLEQLQIDKHFNDKKNVNLTPTAGSPLGYVHTAETRANMSITRKGRRHSSETRAKISASQKGRKGRIPSASTRLKISAAGKGRVQSIETRKKISESNKLRHQLRREQASK
jgi:group I intron endonuclease